MAINPNPDRDTSLMKKDHGTTCLITDPQADAYLLLYRREQLRKSKEIKDSWTI